MQDLEILDKLIDAHANSRSQETEMKIQLAIAERLDGILTEMKESRLQQQGARNEAPGPAQNLYGPA